MQPALSIVAGAVVFAMTVWVVHRLVRATRPAASPNPVGSALIAAAIWLLVLRLFPLALFLFAVGAMLLAPRAAAPRRTAAAQTSRVRSAHLDMTLDHDSGDIDGRILGGPHQGQLLSDLSLAQLLELLAEVRADDQSLKLLETYLDRAHPDWHDHVDADAARDAAPPTEPGDMSREEAYRILGLEPGSSTDEVREAYRRLVKRLHPDSGGSATLTAQITAARDRLLDEP